MIISLCVIVALQICFSAYLLFRIILIEKVVLIKGDSQRSFNSAVKDAIITLQKNEEAIVKDIGKQNIINDKIVEMVGDIDSKVVYCYVFIAKLYERLGYKFDPEIEQYINKVLKSGKEKVKSNSKV